MQFAIEVVFPDFSNDKSAAPVKSFETDVPNTAQFTKFLKSSKLSFESIALKGTNAPIVVEVSIAEGVSSILHVLVIWQRLTCNFFTSRYPQPQDP